MQEQRQFVVAQAQGILMVRHEIDAGSAMRKLVGYSQEFDISLPDAASLVVMSSGLAR